MSAAVELVRRGSIRPEPDPFYLDVLGGLAARPKRIPSKYLWDARGAELYERICDAPEYYVARAERALLSRHAAEIARTVSGASLVELGAARSSTGRALLDHARVARYVPVEADATALRRIE